LRSASLQYATALADIALEQGAVGPVGKQLQDFGAACAESAELRNVLANPAVERTAKHGVIEKLVARMGASRIVRNFLFLVVDNQRTHLLPEILQTFEDVLRQRQGAAEAEVTSAAELTAPQKTQLQQTLERLAPVAAADDVWVITNHWLKDVIRDQMPEIPEANLLAEPCPRNTAPACALAAFLLEKTAPETVLGVFPSDHVVENPERFAEVLRGAIALAAAGENIVVLGVTPTRPETGYGYIERGAAVAAVEGIEAHRVKRFREKPDAHTAERFLAAGNYVWNGGIFLWSAQTLGSALSHRIPLTDLKRVSGRRKEELNLLLRLFHSRQACVAGKIAVPWLFPSDISIRCLRRKTATTIVFVWWGVPSSASSSPPHVSSPPPYPPSSSGRPRQ